MGGKGSKISAKVPALSSKDLDFLSKQTGQTRDQIKTVYEKFMANNPDGVLSELRPLKINKCFVFY